MISFGYYSYQPKTFIDSKSFVMIFTTTKKNFFCFPKRNLRLKQRFFSFQHQKNYGGKKRAIIIFIIFNNIIFVESGQIFKVQSFSIVVTIIFFLIEFFGNRVFFHSLSPHFLLPLLFIFEVKFVSNCKFYIHPLSLSCIFIFVEFKKKTETIKKNFFS